MKESDLYPDVRNFLDSTFKCVWSAIRAGTGQGVVDVLGVRHLAGNLASAEEVVAIEVKRGNEPFLKAAGQALAYSVIAHRVYLAERKVYRQAFTDDEKLIASRLGIGLIEVRRSGCREVLSSPVHDPIPHICLQALLHLGVAKCVLCGCLFERKNTSRKLARARQERRAYCYWLLNHAASRGDSRKYCYDRRFVCPDCVQGMMIEA